MNKIQKNKLFSNDKLPNCNILKEMCNILVNNYNVINNTNDTVEETYNKWFDMIKNTPNYYILVCMMGEEVVGFLCYTYVDFGLMLSEVQIKSEFQGKYNILKNMIKYFLGNIDREINNEIYGTISSKNIKSQNIFKHIGFENIKGVLYKINVKTLDEWVNK